MVVLSACETGLGQILTGEGVIGLTRGFLYAGSSSVLVSQWSVGGEDTARLMVGVYRGLLAGVSRAAALRASKLALIEENAPPRSWSAFVLVGLGA